jgi:hypothetical protein
MDHMEMMAYSAGLQADFYHKAASYGSAKMDAAYRKGIAERNRRVRFQLLWQGGPFLLFGLACLIHFFF